MKKYSMLILCLLFVSIFSISCVTCLKVERGPEASPVSQPAESPSPAETNPTSGETAKASPAEETPSSEMENLPVTDGLIGYWKFDEGEGTAAKDSSKNGKDGTVTGATWTEGKHGKALDFQGEDNIVKMDLKIDQSEKSKGATFCAWVYPSSISEGKHQVISSDNGDFDWSILRDIDKWFVFTGLEHYCTEMSVDVNTWQFLCAVYKPGNGITFYKNAESFKIDDIGYEEDTNTLAIGENPEEGFLEPFDGKIDEVLIYDRPLSEEEIKKIRDR
ncbi:MAG: LamG-like jellyroll fold domain-containing protein [Candidatus Eremiobacterota bacterium]